MKKGHHIQDWSADAEVVNHWGYAERQMPCLNDPGSCAYLDEVYGAHDRGMVYIGVLWLTILAVFTIWGASRLILSRGDNTTGTLGRLFRACSSTVRRHLLADCMRSMFGRTTRLQVLILGILTAYLTVWTFVGITYNKWVTPVEDMPGVYNIRTSLGPWSDRIGVLAYGLTPLSILLSSRESLLSVVTGIPYQHFNFLHRWLGYIIVIQSSLHTIGWCVIEMRLYQPQPMVAVSWITQLYMIWGIVAMILLLMLFALSLPFVVRRTGYEFFRKSHYVLAMVYIGACIGHWEKLHCFLTPSIILWAVDRTIRLFRTWLIHRKTVGDSRGLFHPAQAAVTLFPDETDGDIVRLDVRETQASWHVGQHFYMCFVEGSIWQSHPFTPLNFPERAADATVCQSYVFRAKGGETRKISDMVKAKERTSTPVILTGPYGGNIMRELGPKDNVLCIAGGTGITYVLPVILELARCQDTNRKLELIWFVRHRADVNWIRPELDALEASDTSIDLKIRIFTTRDTRGGDDNEIVVSSPSSEEQTVFGEDKKVASPSQRKLVIVRRSASIATASGSQHPDVKPLVESFVTDTVTGPTRVYASGPGAMMSELRRTIAGCNSGSKVWNGQQRYDVSLECDERLEY